MDTRGASMVVSWNSSVPPWRFQGALIGFGGAYVGSRGAFMAVS